MCKIKTNPDVVRKSLRVNRSWREAHGCHAFEEDFERRHPPKWLWLAVIGGGYAVLILLSIYEWVK